MAAALLLMLAIMATAINGIQAVHTDWSALSRASPSSIVSLRFSLFVSPSSLAALERAATAVSDPQSDKYGQYLTNADIRSIVSAPPSTISSIVSIVSPISYRVSPHGDYLFVTVDAKRAEELFQVEIHQYRRAATGATLLRASTPYTIPSSLSGLVSSISKLSDFPFLGRRSISSFVASDPGMTITPPAIHKKYGIDGTVGSGNPANRQAVAEFEAAYFYESDIVLFSQQYQLAKPIIQIIGPNDPYNGYLGEATLDVEYITATAQNVITVDLSSSHSDFDVIDWAANLTAMANPPLVHSISWGSPEQDIFNNNNLFANFNTEAMKLAALGLTVLVASGDAGVSPGGSGCAPLEANWPASSPWVTAVGATYMDAQDSPEICAAYTGGGFSSYYSQPAYQKAAVASYLHTAPSLPPAGSFNVSGRALPDISALGSNFAVLITNYSGIVSGTSAATPVVAGILALINDARLLAKQPPLGFVNPWLYSLSSVGFDVTSGSNPSGSCVGFTASKGFDLCSGLGTPNFPLLKKSALILGSKAADNIKAAQENK